MANAERGEVELVSGEDRFTLALTMNAICEMQTRTGKTYGDLLRAMPQDYLAFRDMMFMALRRYHAKQFPNLSAVGDWIDQLPDGHTTAADAIGRLLRLNAERGKPNGNGTADPQTAQS